MSLVGARRRSTLTVSTVLVLLAAHSAHSVGHRLVWSLKSVRRYPSTSPLEVTLGDTLTVSCMNDSFSNLYYAIDEAQYENCSCSIASVNATCRSILSCLGGEKVFTIEFRHNSGNVPDAIVYDPGETYYFLSFSDGGFTKAMSGGECKTHGFRMAVYVNERTPTTKPSPSTTYIPPVSGGVNPAASSSMASILGAVGSVGVVAVVGGVIIGIVVFVVKKRHRHHSGAVTMKKVEEASKENDLVKEEGGEGGDRGERGKKREYEQVTEPKPEVSDSIPKGAESVNNSHYKKSASANQKPPGQSGPLKPVPKPPIKPKPDKVQSGGSKEVPTKESEQQRGAVRACTSSLSVAPVEEKVEAQHSSAHKIVSSSREFDVPAGGRHAQVGAGGRQVGAGNSQMSSETTSITEAVAAQMKPGNDSSSPPQQRPTVSDSGSSALLVKPPVKLKPNRTAPLCSMLTSNSSDGSHAGSAALKTVTKRAGSRETLIIDSSGASIISPSPCVDVPGRATYTPKPAAQGGSKPPVQPKQGKRDGHVLLPNKHQMQSSN